MRPDSFPRPVRSVLVALLALAVAVVGGPVPAHAEVAATQITGTLVAPSGVPSDWLDTVKVSASISLGHTAVPGTIAPDGAFVIDGLTPGQKYGIRLEDTSKALVTGWFREDGNIALSWSNGDRIAPGRDPIEVTPRVAGAVAGTLELDATFPSWGYRDATIWLFPTSFDANYDEGRLAVGADGTFTHTGLPAGDSFYLRVHHRWLSTGWVSADGSITTDPALRATVTVGASGELRLTGGNELLQPAIHGTAHVPDGLTSGTVRINAYYRSGDTWRSTYSEDVQPDGSFFLGGLSDADTYRIRLIGRDDVLTGFAGADGTWVPDVAAAEDVPVGATLELHAQQAAVVEGRIHFGPDVVRGSSPQVTAEPATGTYRSTSVQADGTYRISGLFPGEQVRLRVSNRYNGRGADGYLGRDGKLFQHVRDAIRITAPASGVDTTVDPLTSIRGRVELPEGFTLDPARPPKVQAHHETEGSGQWYWYPLSSTPAAVGADGAFEISGAHPRTSYRLELTWPDGRTGFWTSDQTAPARDVTRARTTTPRDDVVFPLADAAPPAPEPEPAPAPGEQLVAPQVKVKVLKAKSTRNKLRVRVNVRAPRVTDRPLGTLHVTQGAARSFPLEAGHRGKRVVTIPRVKARGKVTVRYEPTGSSASTLTSSTTTAKVTKVTPKVKVKTKKRVRAGSAVKVTVRVGARMTNKPAGKIRVKVGKVTRTAKLKARHRGKVTVRVRGLRPGKHQVRARYLPGKKWQPYVTAKKSKKVTVRVR